MTKPPIKCEFISWRRIEHLIAGLAHKIRAANFYPDCIVAIARGGWVPARLLCDHLDVYQLNSLRIIHYTSGTQITKQAQLLAPLNIDVHGQNVLLVDDVSDTGDTLALAREHVQGFHPKAVKIAVIHHKQTSTFIPDFYAQKVVRWRWIGYPWARVEDLCEFVEALQPNLKTAEAMAYGLQQAYRIKVPEDILVEVINVLEKRAAEKS
ncbi:MAG: phosphoribosyltransferase [Pseudomonadota bacterium]